MDLGIDLANNEDFFYWAVWHPAHESKCQFMKMPHIFTQSKECVNAEWPRPKFSLELK